jgi:hypothetical protein
MFYLNPSCPAIPSAISSAIALATAEALSATADAHLLVAPQLQRRRMKSVVKLKLRAGLGNVALTQSVRAFAPSCEPGLCALCDSVAKPIP